jgi:hypothetical protein
MQFRQESVMSPKQCCLHPLFYGPAAMVDAVSLPERIVCPPRAGAGTILRRSCGLGAEDGVMLPALRTIADRTPSRLPLKSTSTRCRWRAALASRSCTEAPDRTCEERRRSRARGFFSLPERDEPGLHAAGPTGRRASRWKPDDRPLCRARIRASRPQRTCGAGRMAYRAGDVGADFPWPSGARSAGSTPCA